MPKWPKMVVIVRLGAIYMSPVPASADKVVCGLGPLVSYVLDCDESLRPRCVYHRGSQVFRISKTCLQLLRASYLDPKLSCTTDTLIVLAEFLRIDLPPTPPTSLQRPNPRFPRCARPSFFQTEFLYMCSPGAIAPDVQLRP